MLQGEVAAFYRTPCLCVFCRPSPFWRIISSNHGSRSRSTRASRMYTPSPTYTRTHTYRIIHHTHTDTEMIRHLLSTALLPLLQLYQKHASDSFIPPLPTRTQIQGLTYTYIHTHIHHSQCQSKTQKTTITRPAGTQTHTHTHDDHPPELCPSGGTRDGVALGLCCHFHPPFPRLLATKGAFSGAFA